MGDFVNELEVGLSARGLRDAAGLKLPRLDDGVIRTLPRSRVGAAWAVSPTETREGAETFDRPEKRETVEFPRGTEADCLDGDGADMRGVDAAREGAGAALRGGEIETLRDGALLRAGAGALARGAAAPRDIVAPPPRAAPAPPPPRPPPFAAAAASTASGDKAKANVEINSVRYRVFLFT